MRLVYLSPIPWESFAQRPHNFVQWFHSRTDKPVLWVDPYPTRFPNWKDLRRSRMPSAIGQYNDTSSWLTVLKPGGLPIEPIPGSGFINKHLWLHTLASIDAFARDSKTLFAIGKPSILALQLLDRFRGCPSLYDAMDDFPAFYTGLSCLALARRERLIAQRVNVIWASSTELRNRWRHYSVDVRLVHNGLDLSAAFALEAPATPDPSANKVFGYVGTIAAWFDWDWICALAEARPQDEVRLIGPIFSETNKKLPNNIRLLPACAHKTALRAMMDFDVGLIPFKRNKLTASVDPIKYYEYRALALPILSSDFGEMHYRSATPGVFICQSAFNAASLIESALQFTRNSELAHAFALENSWEARFDAAKLLL